MNNQRFRAVPDDLSQDVWGVAEYPQAKDGVLHYEELTEQESHIVASLLNETPGLTWDEMEPMLEERLRQKRMKGEDAAKVHIEYDLTDLRGRVETGFGLNHGQAEYVLLILDQLTSPAPAPDPTPAAAPVDWLEEAWERYPETSVDNSAQAAALIAIAQELRKLTAHFGPLASWKTSSEPTQPYDGPF